MQRLCPLGFRQSIEVVAEYERVMLQKGVFGKYTEMTSDEAIAVIQSSPFGAEVFEGEDDIFVSCPSRADMW